MIAKELKISDFSYTLPEERIAAFPLAERDQSALLLYDRGDISKTRFSSLAQHLPEASLLVSNDTRVVRARLVFYKPTGGRIEIFCLKPAEDNGTDRPVALGLQDCGCSRWVCMTGNARRWKEGQEISLNAKSKEGADIALKATLSTKRGQKTEVLFSWSPAYLSFAELLECVGHTPLPPYIKRTDTEDDAKWYQTLFAQNEGSVAAPTAGLHFSKKTLDSLATRNIQMAKVTLHVGAGTFLPVKSETLGEHIMHKEQFTVSRELIKQLQACEGHVTAIGTTSMRVLESMYWLGARWLYRVDDINDVDQWEPYRYTAASLPTRSAVLSQLLHVMDARSADAISGYTSLLIAPSYPFGMTDALLTNFHQPDSTLLLLVAAFLGDDWQRVYQYALDEDFRFLSYGDASLLFPRS